jgi:hypothetical protein
VRPLTPVAPQPVPSRPTGQVRAAA